MKKLIVLAAWSVIALAYQAPANAASLCVPGPNADGLSVTDVTFEGLNATNCYGVVSGNDDLADINGNSELLFGEVDLWEVQLKDDDPTSSPPDGTGTFNNVNWTLTADASTIPGTWTLSFVDSVPSILDFTSDVLVVLKGGNEFAAYFFNDFLFDETTNSGTWEIVFTNNGGQIPDLSHMSVYLRNPVDVPDKPMPEPTSLALLGLGLLGAGYARRRRQ